MFLEFLVFFLPCEEEFLVFLSVFLFFSRDFRGSVGTKNPCFLVVFLAFSKKKPGKEEQGSGPTFKANPRGWWLKSEKVFVSQKRVSGFPEKRLTSGEVRGTSGEVRGTSGEVWETSGEPLDCYSVPQ